jgi:transposase
MVALLENRPPTHSLRVIFDAIFYVLRTSYAWRYLPCNFLPWQTVFYHFRRLRLKGVWFRLLTALRGAERERLGRNIQPSAGVGPVLPGPRQLESRSGRTPCWHTRLQCSVSEVGVGAFVWLALSGIVA